MFKKYRPPIGSRPGTLVVPEDARPTDIQVVRYSQDLHERSTLTDPKELRGVLDQLGTGERVWIHVEGLRDISVLEEIARIFDIHPLALEDAVNVPHRPSVQNYQAHTLFVSWTICLQGEIPDAEQEEIDGLFEWVDPEFAQLSLFIGARYLLTISEWPETALDPIRDRLAHTQGLMRQHGVDYLGYAVLDAVIDSYYPVLEKLGERLDALELEAFAHPTQEILGAIQSARRTLLLIRKAVWPQRDALSTWTREPGRFISEPVQLYLRDTYDHTVQLVEAIETYRETVSGMLNIYVSSVGHRTNDVMKTLTLISTIFIPLTFLVGVWGMNFDFMPELRWRWGYPVALSLMLGVVLFCLRYFRRKGWIGED